MKKDKLLGAVLLALQKIIKNKNDECIIAYSVDIYDTIYLANTGEGFLFSQVTKEREPLAEVDEDELFDIFAFLDGAKHYVKSREKLVELADVDESNWYREPVEIKNREDTIGMVGVAVQDDIAGEKLLSVIFISPDNTYSTLTVFGENSAGERDTASMDLLLVGEYLMGNSNKLTSKKDEKN